MAPVIALPLPGFSRICAMLPPDIDYVHLWEDDAAASLERVTVLVQAGTSCPVALAAQMPRLRMIAALGAGYDGINMDWARARGIAITNTPGANAEDVADQAVALMLGLTQNMLKADRAVRSGEWLTSLEPRPGLRAMKAGIVGFGAIGGAIAQRLAAFGLTLRWWSPSAPDDRPWPKTRTLQELAELSDVLLVAARASIDNRLLIDRGILEALGPSGILINVARGSLVDEDALIAMLHSGALGGAGLDVFQTEPAEADRWRDVPNCLLSPHSAAMTQTALDAVYEIAASNVRAHVEGRPLPNQVL